MEHNFGPVMQNGFVVPDLDRALESADGVINLNADRLDPLTVPIRSASRDFR